MAVVHALPSSPRPAARPAASRGVDADATAAFLRAQAAWLRRGLVRAGDPVAVALVLAAHDRSHERWVRLVATVTRGCGAAAGQRVAALYGFHGHVAGSLERRACELLDPPLAREVRRMIAERLADLIEATVAAVTDAARDAEAG